MSARSKGAKHELEACKELIKQGYLTFKPQKTSRFGSQDIFNMFDIVCMKKGSIRFIQVKTGSTCGFLKRLKEFVKKYDYFESVLFELWVRKNKKTDKITWIQYSMYESEEGIKIDKYEVE